MKEWILVGIISVLAAAGGIASRFVLKKKPDNFIEEFAEKVIKDQTGFNVDLSPDNSDPDGFNIVEFPKESEK